MPLVSKRSLLPAVSLSALLAAGGPALAQSAPAAEAPAQPSASQPADAERLQKLEERLRQLEEEKKKQEETKASPLPAWLSKVTLGGWVQAQFLGQHTNAAASPNLVNGALPQGVGANDLLGRADGTTTNQSLFRIRRARVKATMAPTEDVRFVAELEPFPAGGAPGTGVIYRQLEAQGVVHWTPTIQTEFAAGSFKVPFSYEIAQSDADRDFVERSLGERAMFPGEFDLGMRMQTTINKSLQVHAAVLNGVTIGERTYSALPDLNGSKDGVVRVNYNFGPLDVGAGGYLGTGEAVDKETLVARDFRRWAGNLEAALHHQFLPLGQTRLLGELTFARNMDRTLLPAAGQDLDQRRWFVRLEQDLTERFTVGARYDTYTPSVAIADNVRRELGLLGVVRFTRNFKLAAEFENVLDDVHMAASAPLPGRNTRQLSVMFQAQL